MKLKLKRHFVDEAHSIFFHYVTFFIHNVMGFFLGVASNGSYIQSVSRLPVGAKLICYLNLAEREAKTSQKGLEE